MKASPQHEVVSICEPDAAAREQAQRDPQFQGLRWVSENELLGDALICLIFVECGVPEALPLGRKVIDAGKHLHLESRRAMTGTPSGAW
jgi:hypothetical protein